MSSRHIQIAGLAGILGLALLPLAASAALEDPLGANGSIQDLVTTVLVGGFFPALGIAAFFSVIWGAFQWVSSAGSSERVKLGKDTLLWVAIGLLLAFGSVVVLRFIIETFRNVANIK